MANSPSGESIIDRVMRVLEAFDDRTPSLTPSELSRRASLPSSTTYRLVDEMVAAGLLERFGRDVRIGMRLWELTERSSRALTLREAARPYMDDIRKLLQHHAVLGVLQGHEVLYIERLPARSSAVNIAKIAARLPAHACSAGLILLAHSEPEAQERFLSSRLKPYTANTVTDPAELRKILAQVRRQGYASMAGLIVEQSSGVSVPVGGPEGDVIAALGIVVPVGEENVQGSVPLLQGAALGLGRTLRDIWPRRGLPGD